MVGLAGHVLDAVVDVVGDAAVVRVVKDHQAGQQHGMLQAMHRQRHQIVALALVVQHQGEEGHHEDENDRAANDGIGNTGVVKQLIFGGHVILATPCLCKTKGKRKPEIGCNIKLLLAYAVFSANTLCDKRKFSLQILKDELIKSTCM